MTVRELSSFTITEEPGRAIVDLRGGKLALGLAKHLLKLGESIEVRTPNAVAAVRGSLVVVEVKIIAGSLHTDVFVLEASRPVTVSSRANPMLTVSLLPNDAVSVVGDGTATRLEPITKITPAQAKEIRKTAEMARSRKQNEKLPDEIAAKLVSKQLEQAAQLATQLDPRLANLSSETLILGGLTSSTTTTTEPVLSVTGSTLSSSTSIIGSSLSTPTLSTYSQPGTALSAPDLNATLVTQGAQILGVK